MTRVLLVTDANADYENRSIAARITGATDPRIACSGHTLPPAGAMPHVMHRLMRRERQEEFDVIHAIGPASLTAVLPVGCQPIVYSPPGDQPLRGLSRLRWVSLARRVIVVAGS
ncbi:MAG: hypothetical protein NZ561_06230, partial [Phycisphaerae bacterium]|nr:hypothetical protein [Phycisphaerae bacterium]